MKTIIFICVHNVGRPQMAEALTNKLAGERGLAVRAVSAGTIAGQEIGDGADRMSTMDCCADAACPARLHITEDWAVRDEIKTRVELLLAEVRQAG